MKDSISQRKVQLDFDIDAALFTVTELAQVSGISRSAIDMYLHRGVLIPTRRARTLSPTRKTKVRGGKTAQGRPMFSVIIIFKARLIWELGNTLGLGPSESSLASDEALQCRDSSTRTWGRKCRGNCCWSKLDVGLCPKRRNETAHQYLRIRGSICGQVAV